MFTLPGVGSALGPLYTVSIILTGALATWCWPDIFVRLFSAKSAKTVQRTALQSAPVLLIFGTAVTIVALLASSLPEVAAAPDNVWFITASVGGIGVVTLAAISVVGASLGNVGANLQALGAQTSNDIVGVIQRRRVESPTTAKIAVAVITLLCAGGAFATASTTAGLVTLALISYQGIVQLAPTVFLGIFWKRGTATAALASMIVGFVAAVLLTWIYPVSIPWLGGLTSGLLAMAISTVVYVGCSLAMPGTAEQRDRVERLWQARKAVQQIPVESELVTETT
jgi:SSS family solute:Na+ symporter